VFIRVLLLQVFSRETAEYQRKEQEREKAARQETEKETGESKEEKENKENLQTTGSGHGLCLL